MKSRGSIRSSLKSLAPLEELKTEKIEVKEENKEALQAK